ncbi:MAG: SMI1/KNR4 family protein [Fimbriimonadaceae bacterium]
MIPTNEFWGSNYYKHPPLTDEMVAEAERQLGVKLPEYYVDLLRIQNGGSTNEFAFPMSVRTSWAPDHISLSELAGIVLDPETESCQNIMVTEYMTREWDLPPNQVLLTGEGHWWITLDYRNGPEPSVAWIDVECGEDIQIASSFSAFYAGLVPERTFWDQEELDAESEYERKQAAPPGLFGKIKSWFNK